MKTARINFESTQKVKDMLKKLAEINRRSMTQMIVELIIAEYERRGL